MSATTSDDRFASRAGRLQNRLQANGFLLLSLVAILLLYPHSGERVDLFTFVSWIALMLAVVAICRTRREFAVMLGLGLLDVATTVVTYLRPERGLYPGRDTIGTLFFGLATILLLRRVLRAQVIDLGIIAAAASVYLLLGITWAHGYSLLAFLQPDAFTGIGTGDRVEFTDMLYYSFVTLTTLGYGDITPATPRAQSLAIVQAVTGVLFMGIQIARLVSLYEASPKKDS